MSASPLVCRLLVVKVASRCNLNCSYCYVYSAGDSTYRQQPYVMSRRVVTTLIQRVREHCLRHDLSSFTFVFHGGEPLLAGRAFFRSFVERANALLLPEIRPSFAVQTNGTLLDQPWVRLLKELGVGVGISLDGPPAVHDAQRVDHAGQGSYERVRRGIEAALRHGGDPGPGVLTVIDTRSDPLQAYEHLKEIGVSNVDFLLPDGTYDSLPPGLSGRDRSTPYADWLIAVFDRWFEEVPKPFGIRTFQAVVRLILGGSHTLDSLGTHRNEVLVIETDGGIEPLDSLKVCGHGFTKIGANVLTHALDDALDTELARLYHLSGQRLAGTCRICPIREVCGGGQLPHRYSSHNGFDNPSLYCRDLMKLITHIQNRVVESLPPEIRARTGLRPVGFEEVLEMVDEHSPAPDPSLHYRPPAVHSSPVRVSVRTPARLG